jgi:hypothetical protein
LVQNVLSSLLLSKNMQVYGCIVAKLGLWH